MAMEAQMMRKMKTSVILIRVVLIPKLVVLALLMRSRYRYPGRSSRKSNRFIIFPRLFMLGYLMNFRLL